MRVLPVPVAPAIRPWRFIVAIGRRTSAARYDGAVVDAEPEIDGVAFDRVGRGNRCAEISAGGAAMDAILSGAEERRPERQIDVARHRHVVARAHGVAEQRRLAGAQPALVDVVLREPAEHRTRDVLRAGGRQREQRQRRAERAHVEAAVDRVDRSAAGRAAA